MIMWTGRVRDGWILGMLGREWEKQQEVLAVDI